MTSGELRVARRRKIVRPNIAIITHTGNKAVVVSLAMKAVNQLDH